MDADRASLTPRDRRPGHRRAWIASSVAVLAVVGVVAGLAIAHGCSSATNSSGPAASEAPTAGVAPLTGLRTDASRAALVVKIDDVDAARPQDGLSGADVIFEEMVEGGLTRFAAVYSSRDPGVVGPIRSVRATDLALAGLLGRPAVAFSGGAQPVLDLVDAAGRAGRIVPLSPANTAADTFYRRSGKVAPHDLYAEAAALWEASGEALIPDALFAYGPGPGAVPIGGFVVSFPTTRVAYRWDAATGLWLRSQNGTDQIDGAEPDRTFGVENVVVLQTTYVPSTTDERSPEAQLTGGPAWVYRDGAVSQCTWATAPSAPRVSLRTDTGTTCSLTPGRTVIELAPSPPTPG